MQEEKEVCESSDVPPGQVFVTQTGLGRPRPSEEYYSSVFNLVSQNSDIFLEFTF